MMEKVLYTLSGIVLLTGLVVLLPEDTPYTSTSLGLYLIGVGTGIGITGYIVGLLEDIRDALVDEE